MCSLNLRRAIWLSGPDSFRIQLTVMARNFIAKTVRQMFRWSGIVTQALPVNSPCTSCTSCGGASVLPAAHLSRIPRAASLRFTFAVDVAARCVLTEINQRK